MSLHAPYHKGLLLECLMAIYNVLEAVASITSGGVAAGDYHHGGLAAFLLLAWKEGAPEGSQGGGCS
jgi:hypothetical protein